MTDSFWDGADKPKVVKLEPRKPRPGWQAELQLSDKGSILPNVANVLTILAHDDELASLLAFDSFRSEPFILRALGGLPGPYPRSWGVADIVALQTYLQRSWCSRFTRQSVEDAMVLAAARAPFHPIAVWLDGLRWDGKPRINHWLVNAFDCDNTPYHAAIGAKFLIAACRRVRHPGCKFDYMPVLEGSQGIGKSQTLRELFGDAWFSDSIPPDLGSRDAALALLGVWCLEFAEIDGLIRAEVETVKAFLSRAVDRYRPPYGKAYVERPRQGVLIGTTNSDDYLRDSTGNRRIWPVRCRTASPDWVRVNREQLWAEAAYREATNEPIWLSDEGLSADAVEAQSERMSEDVWAGTVEEWLSGRPEVRTSDVLTHALNVPRERQGRAQDMRVASILRTLGWVRVTSRRGGRPAKVWLKPGLELPR